MKSEIQKIELSLGPRCIQTEIKKRYELLLKQCLTPRIPDSEREKMEPLLEALKKLLENMDFGRMRSTYPEMDGSKETRVVIQISAENISQTVIAADNRFFAPLWKKFPPEF